jgi:eukaryotic-like serine/threonine-protein kinase
MITNEGRIKILDFGLAQRAPRRMETSQDASGTGVNLTEPGTILGTPSYMSPEQARGAVADYRSDQFSFGLVLYELATGKQAFAKASTVETLTAIVRDEPAPIERKVPGPLRWAMDRCLAKEPRERYESTRDLYEDLRSLRDHLSDEYGTSELPGAHSDKVGLSQVWKTMALTVGAVSMLVVAGMWSLGRKNAGADLAGYRYTPLAIDTKQQDYPLWSPDGKAIAYNAWVQGQDHVFVRYLASPVATDLGIRRDAAAPQRWSADSRRIVVFAATPNSTPQNTKFALYSVSAIGGGDPAFITDLPQDSAASETSPDLRTIAVFCRCEGSRWTVFFSSPAGSPWRRYQPDPFAATTVYDTPYLKFASDGTKLLLLYEGEKGEPEAWVLPFPPASGKPRRVLEALPTQTVLDNSSWMPDSRHFVFGMGIAVNVTCGSRTSVPTSGTKLRQVLLRNSSLLCLLMGERSLSPKVIST